MNADEEAVLRLMRDDNLRAGFPFAPRGVWEKLCQDFDANFRVHGVPREDIAYFNQSFSQSPPGNPRYHRYAVYMLYRLIKQRDATDMLGRFDLSSDTGYEIAIDGRRYSWDTLISLDTILSIAEADPGILTDRRVVADLGSGWGRIGYVLKRINPRVAYLLLDLPEILMISMAVLPRLLPGESTSLYAETRAAPTLTKSMLLQKGLWFAGSQDLLKVADGAIDVFINVASFQEMKLSQVRTYFDLIDRKVSGIFYTQQYVVVSDAQRPYNAIGGLDQYPIKPAWAERFKRYTTFSERFFEAGFGINQQSGPHRPLPALPASAPAAFLRAANAMV
ncbi:MAG TPA: putative sugar O-methyltransferase [Pirellulales bacterium]|jgi:putative sugar O-methyltransferase|nr:putative sugar O-methyltransferase [Pirellulales bacterium]